MESYLLVNRVAASKSSRVQYLSLKTRAKSIDAALVSRGVDVIRLEQKDWNPYVFLPLNQHSQEKFSKTHAGQNTVTLKIRVKYFSLK